MTQHNEVETLNNDMTIIPARDKAVQIYSQPCGLDPYLKHIREEIDRFKPNTGTAKGRSEIASMAHKVARSKTALDGLGKELVAELKEMPRKIDAERKRMRDTLDQWKEEVRQPLTEWEQAELAKREADRKHKARINREAVADLVTAGLTEDQAKAAVTAIAKGAVRNVRMVY